MKVGVVQYAAGFDKAENVARLRRLAERAAADGAELVVAPEGAMHDFGPPDLALAQFAEPLDGRFVTGLAEIATAQRITVVAGMFEAVADDPARAYNTVVAVGPDGLIGSYRKQHLFDALGWVESDRLVGGEPADRLVFGCGDVTVGVMTCYDIRFPELGRALADDGATLLAVPSAWVAGPRKPEQFRALATARAIENVCYVAGAVQTPPDYTGESCVIEPFGEVLASLGTDEGYAVAEVNPRRVEECRSRMPSLTH
ncbi:MAG: carbon-nitrogen hydrolase family protein, partial [Frankiaceae bacterium]|nr:carbon-nitrogen hydrolase family protein [Frankiaceae bacterium]